MTSKHFRLSVLSVLSIAALHAGALGAQQQQVVIETVRGTGGGGIALDSISGGLIGGAPMLPVDQSGSGILVGQIIEAGSQRPVAGALVTLGGALNAGAGRGGMMMISRPASTPGVDPVPRVMTDQDGRFAFRNLPRGQFNLSAEKAGYLDGAYGRLRPDGPGQAVEFADGEHRDDIVIRMFLPSTITGRLVDDRGEPLVNAEIRAYRRTLVSGRRVLNLEGRPSTTDDRGVYRIANLTPGEYVVAAPTTLQSAPANFQLQGGLPPNLLSTMMTPGNGGSISYSSGGSPMAGGDFVLQGGRSQYSPAPEIDGRLLSYPTVYFPSALVASEAQPVAVRSGETRSGVDIALGLVQTTTIAGRLMGPDGPAASYALHLVPSDTGDLSADPDVATAITAEDGRFMFLGVPAGNYVIQTVRIPRALPRGDNTTVLRGGGNVMVFAQRIEGPGGARRGGPPQGPPPEPEPTLWTAVPVSVGGGGLADLTISLEEGTKIEGRIEFEGAADSPGPDQMTRIVLVVEPVDGRQRPAMPAGRVTEDGRFSASGLLPGRYVVRALNAGPNWTLKSVTMGGIDVSEVPIELERDLAGLVVTFTDRAASLSGMARNDEGSPDAAAAVLIFPADNRLWVDYGTNPRRMRLVRTSATGAFSFSAIPPGDYHLVAIPEEVSAEWQDPRVLSQLTSQAARVTVVEGGTHTQDLATQPFRGIVGGAPFAEVEAASEPVGHGPFVPDAPEEVAAVQQMRDTRVVPRAGAASISGVVVLDDGTNQPVRRARVSLRSAESRTDYAVMTDDTGRFTLAGLPAGRYSLTTTKPAYVTTYYGSRQAGRGPGVPLALTEGMALDSIVLRMPRGAVVAGRVVDEFGQPFPNASVRIMQFQMTDGRRALRPVGGPLGDTQTDDRGQYRVFGLMPGQYVVMVTPPRQSSGEVRQLSSADVDAAASDVARASGQGPAAPGAPGQAARTPFGGRAVGFAPVYYPGSTDPASASSVNVGAGQVLEGVDLTVPLVPTARLEGVITGPDGQPVGNVTALLLPENGSELVSIGSSSIVRTRPDGTFSVMNVAPGRYKLTARSNGPGTSEIVEFTSGGMFMARSEERVVGGVRADATSAGPPAKPLWAQALVDVNGQDLSGLALTLQEGMTITGRVLFDGTRPPPADVSGIRIGIAPAETGNISLGAPGDTIGSDGTFTLEGVTPGAYRLTARVPPDGFSADSAWQLKSVIVDGQDALDTHLVVRPGQNIDGLTVTFTDRMSELSGTVLDPAGAPVSDLTILMFPTESAFWSASARRMPRPQQPGSDGRFTFPGLPPGDYFLAAVTEIDQDSWGDPAFMEQVAAAAIRITLGEGEKKVQDLRIGGGL